MNSLRSYIVILAIFITCPVGAQENSAAEKQQNSVYKLKNSRFELHINLFGGAYVNMHLKNPKSVNPLTWDMKTAEMPPNNKDGAPFRGHFLCLGRWGSPTKGEIAQGVPHNGQASNTTWKVLGKSDNKKLIMTNHAPLDGMRVKRIVRIEAKKSVFHVTEKITNTTTIARLNNVVQHVTIGPPFLNKNTRINTNAGPGFLQEFAYPNPEKFQYCFPFAIINEKDIHLDIRKTHIDRNYVSTHVMRDTLGWVTAIQPERDMVLGYIWETTDYPWINIWNQSENKKAVAKGLEFGTTGVGQPYGELLDESTRFHSESSFELLDAGETQVKSFTGFISRLPENVSAIERVEKENTRIILVAKNGKRIIPGR